MSMLSECACLLAVSVGRGGLADVSCLGGSWRLERFGKLVDDIAFAGL